MRLLLVGAGFKNKGAEAMTLTLRDELGARVPDLEFAYWDCPPEQDDLARAAGLLPVTRPRPGGPARKVAWVLGEAVRRGGLRPSHLTNPLTLWPDFSAGPMLSAAEPYDAVAEISGFAYGDAWGAAPARAVLPVVRDAQERGRPVVYLPQAWGPLVLPPVRDAVAEMIAGPRALVYARDALSASYLEALELPDRPIRTATDIVFAFRGAPASRAEELLRGLGCTLERPVIAFAPNMRAYERSEGQGEANGYVRTLAALARHCIDERHADVVLLPSECAPVDRNADDRMLCRLIRSTVQRDDACYALTDYVSAPDLWALIGRSDFLVASRYHATVFALSQGVPSVVIGWSHKYAELMRAFEAEQGSAGHEGLTEVDAIDLFDAVWIRRHERRAHILRVAEKHRAQAQTVFDEVARFLLSGGEDAAR